MAMDATELKSRPPARISRQEAIADLGQRALLDRDVDGLMDRAVGYLTEALDVEFASILHQSTVGEPLVLVAGSGWNADVAAGSTTVSCDRDSQERYALLAHAPVFATDLAQETRFEVSRLLQDHGVASSLSVRIEGQDAPYGILGVHSARHRKFTVGDGEFLTSVAKILGSAVENRIAVEQVEQNVRYGNALAECAQYLLASDGDNRIEHALEALLVATEATYVFIERNVVDPELGLCSRFVAEAHGPGTPDSSLQNEYWNLVPWDSMPTSRKALENGDPIVIIPSELEGPEYDQYAADPFPIKAELNIPIFVDGEWDGLIGFSDETVLRTWSDTDVSLLSTAAKMFSSFWEREADRERLEQLNRAKDEFVASVSHELRTPLTAVVGFSRILQDEAHTLSEPERAELLEMVVEQGADLANMISDLLVAAKAGVGSLEVSAVPVDIRAQAAQVIESFDREQVAGIEFSGPSVRAVGDPDRVRQIVRNLISNALRYGGETIRVDVRGDANAAKVLVCDSGSPIPDDDRERIFQPYQRAHDAPGLAGSIGLGLAISRQLAQLMGGDVTYRHDGNESIFELTLPRTV